MSLGPMQRPLVRGQCVDVAAVRLDFFEPARGGVIAVGPAHQPQLAELPLQAQLAAVAWAAPRGDDTVALNAFHRAGPGGETQIKVATLGGKFAEHANRHSQLCTQP